ncbi:MULTISPECIES: GNAT family N-acetyltransferase [Lactiplantibacillus]|jgi:ribosomal protein S18 acetylase RimI-like enzyme|uniref:GNAT family N-acetyltransferase n=1 Tax=Lactiplantibacillus pentosus TaxID=1589 RepID=A0A2K9I1C1_LACPE|nr:MULTISPECIES: GNAT family N-acetyltransferase [Lactiplantibacillus]MCH4129977.1 GNAT family N-acetyltransferase [Lactiplantibacillus sp.]BBM20021.1 transcription repressor [Lactiplantibacillus plantarum]AUI78697.1 GNAT family N-acetyltransferase [Lactiplantibacillus pentosus]MBU7459782.1 GNAT family N-acetyltransferase [Lactiplantibacillus pentosus]MBU7462936.1 GNAT family N-acetyltransferase [Lactiplantibacillus pentosus]
MSQVTITPITVADAPTLQQISIETFQDTFGAQNTAANMQAYLQQAYQLNTLETELANPHSSFFFIGQDNEIMGYLKLNTDDAQSEAMGEDTLEVERIYIRPGYQHRGLGRQLMQFALTTAKQAGKQRIWLGVWEHNEPAKRFYAKWGFRQFSAHDFVMGTDWQTDLLMIRPVDEV